MVDLPGAEAVDVQARDRARRRLRDASNQSCRSRARTTAVDLGGRATPRFSGAAGALVGHGAAWSWLLMTSSIFCQMSCSYTLAYGPAHLTDGPAWQRETWVWFALAVGILLAGLILTIWTARRLRQELRAS